MAQAVNKIKFRNFAAYAAFFIMLSIFANLANFFMQI
jgi:hypothetical protein